MLDNHKKQAKNVQKYLYIFNRLNITISTTILLVYVYLAVYVVHLICRPSFSFSIVFGSSKLLDRFLADARGRWGYDLCKSQQRVVFCGGFGGPVRIAFAGIERECMFNAALRHSTYAIKQ